MGSFGNLNINGMKQVRCGKAENNAVKGNFNNVHKKILSAMITASLISYQAAPLITRSADAEKAVVINEICTKNTQEAAPDGSFYDYVELYNSGSDTVSLKGYSLSDDAEHPKKYVFPDDAVIQAGDFYTVYCGVDENSGTKGAAFGLSKDGETLVFSDADGNVLECVEIPALADNTAYGRINDGSGKFGIFSGLTPGKPNPPDAISEICVPEPVFSKESGFYADEFELNLSAPEGYNIYYTLDGSDPTKDSARYEQPVKVYDRSAEDNVYSAVTDIHYDYTAPEKPVDKAMIVRAAAEDSDGNLSRIVSKTYFVGYSEEDHEMNMRVISLVTDPDNLFDDEKGIYVNGINYNEEMGKPNYSYHGKEWERPVNMTVFEKGKAEYSADMGIRIRGAASRMESQKSFALYARSEYGPRKIEYDFFDGKLKDTKGKTIDKFDCIILRNGGNDVKTKIRDRLNQELAADRSFGTQAQNECVVFIDGEFWGLYNINEKLSEEYVSDHYDVKKKDVLFVKASSDVTDEITSLYKTIDDAVFGNDGEKAYEEAAEVMDMQCFADYMAVEIICANCDSGDNNLGLWKTRNVDSTNPYADGKVRFLMYDTEAGQGMYRSSAEEDNVFVSKSMYSPWAYSVLFELLNKSEKFRGQFLRTYFDLCNENYRADNVLRRLDELQSAYMDPMTETFERFTYVSYSSDTDGIFTSAQGFANEVRKLRDFWKDRDYWAKQHLIEFLGDKICSKSCNVTLNNNSEQGSIGFNTLELDCADGEWQGSYPQGLPLKLEALPIDGYKFVRWDISGAEFSSGDEMSREAELVTYEEDVTIRAVYGADDQYQLGDVNGDKMINSVDASAVLAYYAHLSTDKEDDLSRQQKIASDVNDDGAINAVDASCILSYYAYISTSQEKVSLEEYLETK
ncbi:CotH kinase family protein [Ruminococcus flavefaciens]|uniref:CotH kinase family protein n=1 Tax=Ruminococcus flavefaciens TaxID=1265 RepID=UPI0026EE9606|nr:CotH kinase family protein [Ruminococcus flavefaciens]